MKHKNDYSCIVFFEKRMPKKWEYVHKLGGFVTFLNTKHKGWKYVNVYERSTKRYLRRFYPGNQIPDFLTIFLITIAALSSAFAQPCKTLNSTFNNSPLTFNNGFNNPATISTRINVKGGSHACSQ